MNIRETALMPFFAVLIALSASVATAQEETEPKPPVADPTAPSDQFREIADLLREADRVKKVFGDNERLQKQVTDLLAQSQQLTAAVEAARDENRKLTTAVQDVLARNAELTKQNEELKATLDDVSQVEVQGLLLSAEGSSTALLKIAGKLRVVRQGERLSAAIGADRSAGQTVLVKEIGEDGVHLEMGDSGRTVIIQ